MGETGAPRTTAYRSSVAAGDTTEHAGKRFVLRRHLEPATH